MFGRAIVCNVLDKEPATVSVYAVDVRNVTSAFAERFHNIVIVWRVLHALLLLVYERLVRIYIGRIRLKSVVVFADKPPVQRVSVNIQALHAPVRATLPTVIVFFHRIFKQPFGCGKVRR